MRVTQGMMMTNSLRYSQSSYQRLSTLYDQISAQRKLPAFPKTPLWQRKACSTVNHSHKWNNTSEMSMKLKVG